MVGTFYILPVSQLMLSYQKAARFYGSGDLCFYNFLCKRPLLPWFDDFNHVFSNIAYIFCGVYFIVSYYMYLLLLGNMTCPFSLRNSNTQVIQPKCVALVIISNPCIELLYFVLLFFIVQFLTWMRRRRRQNQLLKEYKESISSGSVDLVGVNRR